MKKILFVPLILLLCATSNGATTNVFFNPSQTAALVASNINAVTITGVPWYLYEAQRATNIMFTGTLQTWPVQAWADGSIFVWDDFTDLGGKPPQAFYRLLFTP